MKIKLIVILFFISAICTSCSKDNPKENKAPSVPALVYPKNLMECAHSSLKFTWLTSNDPEGEQLLYEIQLSNNDDFKDLSYSKRLSRTEIKLALEPGKTYYWRIRAIDNEEMKSKFSGVRSLFTEPLPTFNYVPYSPRVMFPDDKNQVTEAFVLLEWESEDPDGDSMKYDLYLDSTNPPTLYKKDLQFNTFEIELKDNTTYYWRIVVKDGKGAKSVGDIWTFSII